jgi:chromosomal replication initiation ATPase DnaA
MSKCTSAVTADSILEEVCRQHSVARDEVLSAYRSRRVVRARREVAYLLRVRLSMRLARIGKYLGGRRHSTIAEAIEAFAKRKRARDGEVTA